MTHVVLVSRIYAPEPAAAAFRLRALVEALVDDRAEVTVLTTTARRGLAALPDGGARVLRRPALRDKDGFVRGYLPYLSFDLPVALRLLTVRRPDVVVVEPPPTTGAVVRVVCALRRVPYVYYAADIVSDAARGSGTPAVVARVVAAIEGWALRGARGVIAVSAGVAARVRELAGPRPEVAVVLNGVDTSVFRPLGEGDPATDRPAGAPARFAVYTGTASAWHGADVFVRALPLVRAVVPDLELVLIGQGGQWLELEALAAELAPGLVHLLPPVPAEDAATWLRLSELALASVRPGMGYDFAMATKFLAAVASGTPVVYAGPGPASELIVEGKLGLAVEHDVEAVASAMITLLTGPEASGASARAVRAARLADWARRSASLEQVGSSAALLVRRWADDAPRTVQEEAQC